MDARTRQKNFLHLLERIGEPLYLGPRGHGQHPVVFNLPPDVLEEYEAKAVTYLTNKIPATTEVSVVTVNKPTKPYDLTLVTSLVPRNGIFSNMLPSHQKAVQALTKILVEQHSISEYFNTCSLCRDVVNPHLWLQAFISSAIRRADMKGFFIPNLWEISPDLFIEAKYLKEVHKQSALPVADRGVIQVDLTFTGFDTNPEHKVAYWREDLGLNSFHAHYHIVNPITAPKGSIDRQGEKFYAVHHEMLARYNAERLSNRLNRVTEFEIHEGSSVEEAYHPNLTLFNSAHSWSGRQENTVLKDVRRFKDPNSASPADPRGSGVSISDLRIWLDRVKESIDAGFAISEDGKKISLRGNDAVDILCGFLEPTLNSINKNYYGFAHNFGHLAIGLSHDPEFKYKQEAAVMTSTTTACRDPIFFRWHGYVDSIIRRLKNLIPTYTTKELLFQGVSISKVEVHTPSLETNRLVTFWMQSDVDLSRGLDFLRSDINNLGPIWARITHLQHRDFEYKISVRNTVGREVTGTVRIYMAPKNDEQGDPLPLSQQRLLFFQLDKFTTKLKAGENTITRKSTDSALTIPWDQTFRKLERDVAAPSRKGVQAHCGCGWPQHLLIPKGRHEGLPMDLFVMITDWETDHVPDPNAEVSGLTEVERAGCVDTVVLCGALGKKYPDAKPMGFPLDRPTGKNPTTNLPFPNVTEYAQAFSNMKAQEVNIFHRDTTVIREGDGASSKARIIKC